MGLRKKNTHQEFMVVLVLVVVFLMVIIVAVQFQQPAGELTLRRAPAPPVPVGGGEPASAACIVSGECEDTFVVVYADGLQKIYAYDATASSPTPLWTVVPSDLAGLHPGNPIDFRTVRVVNDMSGDGVIDVLAEAIYQDVPPDGIGFTYYTFHVVLSGNDGSYLSTVDDIDYLNVYPGRGKGTQDVSGNGAGDLIGLGTAPTDSVGATIGFGGSLNIFSDQGEHVKAINVEDVLDIESECKYVQICDSLSGICQDLHYYQCGDFGNAIDMGDLDGDGQGDFVAHTNFPEKTLLVMSGADKSVLQTIHKSTPDFSSTTGSFHQVLAKVPDADGDGLDDIAYKTIGDFDPLSGPGYYFGRVYLFSSGTGEELWSVEGEETNVQYGFSFSGSEDLDGDGKGEVIVGAERFDGSSGFLEVGRVYVYSGANGSVLGTIDPPAADLQNFLGFGYSVSSVGDVNDDGTNDIVVGARGYINSAGKSVGKIYIYSGKNGKLIKSLEGECCNPLNPSSGAKFGEIVSGGFVQEFSHNECQGGSCVVVTGDSGPVADQCNSDLVCQGVAPATEQVSHAACNPTTLACEQVLGPGVDQCSSYNDCAFASISNRIVVSANAHDVPIVPPYKYALNAGRILVYDGTGTFLYEITALDVETGTISAFGNALAGIGDLDGDGVTDFVASARTPTGYAMGLDHGTVYAFSAAQGDLLWEVPSDYAVGDYGFFGSQGDNFGFDLTNIPDVNGDGIEDVVVLAQKTSELEVRSGADGTKLWGDSIIGAGKGNFDSIPDVNGDGKGDIVTGYTGTTDIPISVTFGHMISGADGSIIWTGFGGDTAIPDLDGDGIWDVAADVSTSAPSYSVVGFFGPFTQEGGWDVVVSSGVNGSALFNLTGPNLGTPLCPAGKAGCDSFLSFIKGMVGVPDVNGDGKGDIALFTNLLKTSGPIFDSAAGDTAPLITIMYSGADGAEIWRSIGETNTTSIGSIKDIDGDGITDILIGYSTFWSHPDWPHLEGPIGKTYVLSGATGAIVFEQTPPFFATPHHEPFPTLQDTEYFGWRVDGTPQF